MAGLSQIGTTGTLVIAAPRANVADPGLSRAILDWCFVTAINTNATAAGYAQISIPAAAGTFTVNALLPPAGAAGSVTDGKFISWPPGQGPVVTTAPNASCTVTFSTAGGTISTGQAFGIGYHYE